MNRSVKEIYQSLKGNLYFQLIKRILVIFFLYALCRLVFFIFNFDLYKDRTLSQILTMFAGGLRFDTTAILYTNSLYILMFLIPFKFRYNRIYQIMGKSLYLVINGIALAANCIDIVYFRFTMRRSTFDVFKEFEGNTNIDKIFAHAFIDYWPILLFFIGIIVLMVLFYGSRVDKSSIRIQNQRIYYWTCSGACLLGIFIIIFGIRGSFKEHVHPLAMTDAGAYAVTAIDMPLIQNTPFAAITNIPKKGITPLVFFEDQQELEQIYTPIHRPVPNGPFTGENVMLIILEGFSRELVGSLNPQLENGQYKGYTPFLDSLVYNGRAFLHAYANGRGSIDAMPSALLGIPAISGQFTLSKYVNNMINSVPAMLRKKGYETAFFTGQPTGTMGFAPFSNLIGFNYAYEMEEYGNNIDFDGTWGIWDEEFLQFTAKTINRFPEPFFATVFTVTSHHPFPIPGKYKERFLPEPAVWHRSFRYTDHALRQFFKTASKEPWYNNTLFILMADHAGDVVRPEYKTSAEAFAIPIIFFRPDGSLKSLEDQVVQQLDIMPTLLSYLNYDQPYVSFGFDLNQDKDHFAVNYLNGIYQIYRGDYLLTFDGTKTIGLYDIRKDIFMEHDLVGTLPEIQAEAELKIKAFLQQYTTRMVENRLTVNSE